jgi:WD40 repeat protein
VAVTVDDDGMLRVWDLETEGMTHALEAGREVWFSAAAVAPGNAQAVLGCWGGRVMLFDLLSGDTLRTLEGHTADVNVIEASPDGTYAVSGSDDKTAVVWHLPTGRKLGVLEGHTGMVTALAITPDGRRVVTGSSDATLRVWEVPYTEGSAPATGGGE